MKELVLWIKSIAIVVAMIGTLLAVIGIIELVVESSHPLYFLYGGIFIVAVGVVRYANHEPLG